MGSCTGPTGKVVFVTSSVYDGNLGGLAGADLICQTEAEDAGLSGTYKAWLADSTGAAPINSFVHSDLPYVLVDHTVVANDWVDLTDRSLANPINSTPYGYLPSVPYVWTNVSPGGVALTTNPIESCGDWTTNSDYVGPWTETTYVTPEWTEPAGFELCYVSFSLYCFEQ